jgi:hypothetical protein
MRGSHFSAEDSTCKSTIDQYKLQIRLPEHRTVSDYFSLWRKENASAKAGLHSELLLKNKVSKDRVGGKYMDRRDFLSAGALGAGYFLLKPALSTAMGFSAFDEAKPAIASTRASTETEMVIHGIEVPLDPASIPANKDLLVFGDIVYLSNNLVLPGRRVRIHARKVIFNRFAFDTSGSNGSDAQNSRATDGITPAGSGSAGASGGTGGKGGDILILAEEVTGGVKLTANGGDGGRGEPGGFGGLGAQGAAGADNHGNAEASPCGSGQQGQRGGTGGIGGNGGAGGPGGNSGTIQIKSIRSIPSENSQFLAVGGAGGQGGTPGRGGSGGTGGIGGINTERREHHGTHGGDSWSYCANAGRAPDGASGVEGNAGQTGSNAVRGTSTIGNASEMSQHLTALSDYGEIARNASINQLLLILHAAELDYLNNNSEALTERLGWLQNLLARDEACSTSWSPSSIPNVAEIRSLRGRVTTLVAQLQAGLDFYGLPSDYVPLVALDLYKDTVKQILQNATEVETLFFKYQDLKNSQDERLSALDRALHAAKDNLSTLTSEMQRIEQTSNDTQNAVADLSTQLQEQYTSLIKANDAFKHAVSSRASCDLLGTLQFVGTIVPVVAGAYQNVAALVVQAQKLGTSDTQLHDIVTTVKTATNALESMKTAFNDVRPLVAVNANSAKIAMAEEDVDTVVKPYLDMPEAQNYKAQAHLYVETAKTRNSKQMEYTSLALEAESERTKISQQVEEIARTEARKAETNNPDAIEAVVFMGKLLTETKQRAIRALYKERKSFEYWSLTRTKFTVQDQDVSRLVATHNDLLSDELQAREDRNRADQIFTAAVVVIAPEDDPERFATFKRTGRLTFEITSEHPSFAHGYSAVTVSEVSLSIPGAETKEGALTAYLTHSGRSTFLSPAKQSFRFSHARRVTNLTFSLLDPAKVITPTKNNLGGEAGEYAYISPFAVWTISIEKAYNVDLDLHDVSSINLSFNGYFLPFSS